MPYENITFERDEEVATITINREKVRNTPATISEIYAALRVFEEDDELRVAIITGASDQPSPPAADKR